MLILKRFMPHIGPSVGVAKRIKHSHVTSASKKLLAKEHLVMMKKKEEEEEDNKQIIVMRCDKCYIRCINICLSTPYYSS